MSYLEYYYFALYYFCFNILLDISNHQNIIVVMFTLQLLLITRDFNHRFEMLIDVLNNKIDETYNN